MGNPINVFVYGIQGQVRKVTERTMIFKKKKVSLFFSKATNPKSFSASFNEMQMFI